MKSLINKTIFKIAISGTLAISSVGLSTGIIPIETKIANLQVSNIESAEASYTVVLSNLYGPHSSQANSNARCRAIYSSRIYMAWWNGKRVFNDINGNSHYDSLANHVWAHISNNKCMVNVYTGW